MKIYKSFLTVSLAFFVLSSKAEAIEKNTCKGTFSEELIPIELENGKWGYGNKEGLAVVKVDGFWGVFNK